MKVESLLQLHLVIFPGLAAQWIPIQTISVPPQPKLKFECAASRYSVRIPYGMVDDSRTQLEPSQSGAGRMEAAVIFCLSLRIPLIG
jgi:hypothetical protein